MFDRRIRRLAVSLDVVLAAAEVNASFAGTSPLGETADFGDCVPASKSDCSESFAWGLRCA